MAVTEEIAWGDGSGDKIYLTTNALEGDQTVLVSSDANAGDERTKVVTFTAGLVTQTLTVKQEAGYEPVFYGYLYFDGTAYIDTDIVPTDNSSFRVGLGMERLESAQRIFDMTGSSGHIRAILGSNTSSTSRSIAVYYDTTAYTSQTLAQTNIAYNFFFTPNNFGWGSAVYAHTKGSNYPSSNLVIGAIASHSGQAYTGYIGQFRIYGSDAQNVTSDSELNSYTPYKTLRPCKYGSRSGLWCVEDAKFYGNTANAGTLIACSRLSANVSSYDSTNYAYKSLSNVSNAYNGSSNTTYATIGMVNGESAVTYIYFKFDTSSIPAGASIISVMCVVPGYISNSTYATVNLQMFSGTTAKGTASANLSSTKKTFKFSGDTWTREEVNDVRVRVYGTRGASKTTDARNIRFYGATLYVLYTV